MGEIILLTGEMQSGKTRLCLDLFQLAQDANIRVGGVISPAVFEGDRKTAIDVIDLKSGILKRLAELRISHQSDLETQRWAFIPEVVNWGNEVLGEAVPCDLLIVDELGPLEFYRDEGWVNGFSALDSGEYQLAWVVIRPSLVEDASKRWNISRIINMDEADPDLKASRDLLKFLKSD